MSITDELREYADRLSDEAARKSEHGFSPVAMALKGIADRIDAEHEATVSYWQGESYRDGYDEGFASADDWLGQHEDAMAEHGWVKQPVDADGVTIRVGDTLDGYGKTIEVVEMRYGRGGWVLISRDGNGYADTFAFAHHHAPTVEDVLRDFAQEMSENLGMYTGEAIDADEWRDADARTVEKYAERLELREVGA